MAGHRERLLEGIVRAASRHGYAGASVARVAEASGTSRATFYEHFADREDCFLAAYRGIAARMTERVREASAEAPVAARPRVVLEALLAELAADPAATRVLLVEAFAAGRATRAEQEDLIAEAEAALADFLDSQGEPERELQIPAAALLGGVLGTVSMHVFRGEGESLPSLGEGLSAWISAYSLPAGEIALEQADWRELGVAPAQPPRLQMHAPLLPRGRSAIPQPEAAEARRGRILAATARMSAEKGYAAFTVADITAAARVTRSAFYSHFRGKEDAFLTAQAAALQESIGAAASEFFAGRTWPERVWNAAAAMLGYIASHPDLAYLGIVEAHAVGAAAIHRQHDARTAYTVFLEEGYRDAQGSPEPLPRLAFDAIAWAVFALLRGQVVRGRATEALTILPAVAYTILAPFIGPARAMEFVEAQSRSARRGSRTAR